MKEGTVKDEFSVYIRILKYLLYWPIESQSNFNRNVYKLFAIIKITVTSVLYVFIQCATAYKNGGDLSKILEAIFMTFTLTNYLVKVFCYTYSNKEIQIILEKTGKDIFQSKNAESKEIIFKSLGIWKIIFRFYMAVCISAVLFWSLGPIISKSESGLPFGYWYPFDVSSTPVYELIYIYEIGGLLTMVISHVSLDAMMAGIMAFIARQIDVLNENLRNLNYSDGNDDDKAALVEQIECFALHRNIKRLVRDLNSILIFPMFIQSTLGAIILCTAMYKLSKVALLSGDGLSIISYYMAMVTELVIYFWYGNEIIWKSNEIPKAAYQCNWISMDKGFKTNILLFMLSTRKPLQVSGGYFIILSLSPLITILKCSWSYLAVLRTM